MHTNRVKLALKPG